MNQYQYHMPRTINDALSLKAERGAKALFCAGGTDVHVLARAGRLECSDMISLTRVEELKRLEFSSGRAFIGSGVTLTRLMESPEIENGLPALHDAVQVMGCTQMRNMATIGGNVMSAVSSGDTLPPLLCLGADCVLASGQGERRVALSEMFTGPRATAARPDELLLGIEADLQADSREGSAFIKLGRRAALDLAVVGFVVWVRMSADGAAIESARAAAGAVGPTPLRLYEAEKTLNGRPPTDGLLKKAAEAALGECSPWDDVRASKWYRQEMIKTMLPRAAEQALARAGAQVAS